MKILTFLVIFISFVIPGFAQRPIAKTVHTRSGTSNVLKGVKSIYLSAHTPMWSAAIDLMRKQFIMTNDDGSKITKSITIHSTQKKIVIQSDDTTLKITLNKVCDCPYDIPEKDPSRWKAILLLNQMETKSCAYFLKQ